MGGKRKSSAAAPNQGIQTFFKAAKQSPGPGGGDCEQRHAKAAEVGKAESDRRVGRSADRTFDIALKARRLRTDTSCCE